MQKRSDEAGFVVGVDYQQRIFLYHIPIALLFCHHNEASKRDNRGETAVDRFNLFSWLC